VITEWDKLVNRIRLETGQRLKNQHLNGTQAQAVVAISVSLLVDCEGNPLTWIVESSNVEPGARAKTLLELYSSL
jgi:hypothetical protein